MPPWDEGLVLHRRQLGDVSPELVRSSLSPMSASESKMRSFLGILLKNRQLKTALLFLPLGEKTNHLRPLFWKLLGGAIAAVDLKATPTRSMSVSWWLVSRGRRSSVYSAAGSGYTHPQGRRWIRLSPRGGRVEKYGPLIHHAVAELEGPLGCGELGRRVFGAFIYFKRFTNFSVCITSILHLHWCHFIVKRTTH